MPEVLRQIAREGDLDRLTSGINRAARGCTANPDREAGSAQNAAAAVTPATRGRVGCTLLLSFGYVASGARLKFPKFS